MQGKLLPIIAQLICKCGAEARLRLLIGPSRPASGHRRAARFRTPTDHFGLTEYCPESFEPSWKSLYTISQQP